MSREEGRQRVSGRRRAEEHKSGFDRTAFKIPDGMGMISIKQAGVRRFDFLCYVVGDESSSGGRNPNADPGTLHFERTFWVHRGIGPNEDSYVCPAKTLNKPCPICEARAKLAKRADVDPETVKELAPKERQLWLVIDYGEPDKGPQLFEMSYHLFGKVMDNRLKDSDPDDEYEFFADPMDGKMVKAGFGEKSMGSNKFFECTSLDFKARPEGTKYGKKFTEALPCLDDLLIVLPYDKLNAIFLQTAEPDKGKEEDDEPPRKPKRPAPTDDDDEPAPPPKKKPAPADDDDEPAPPKKKAPPAEDDEPPPKKKAKPAPADDDDWGEDPAPPPKKKAPPPPDEDEAEPPPKKKAKPAPADDEDAQPPPKKKAPPPADDDWE